jgi:phosphoribosylaminoimidazolecarboxamide formyltransferase/IMP cyclohydrolase
VNASDYDLVVAELKEECALSYETRFDLAVKSI